MPLKLTMAMALLALVLGAGTAQAQQFTASDVYSLCHDLEDRSSDPEVAGCKAKLTAACAAAPTPTEIDDANKCVTAQRNALGGGGGAGGGPASLPWVGISTDFFVARARAELAHFVKEEVRGAVCKEAIADTLLVSTCKALDGDDIALSGLPRAIREDLEELPDRLIDLAIEEAKKAFTSAKPEVQKLVCFAEAAWEAYIPLRDQGPLAALRAVGAYTSFDPTTCDTHVKHLKNWATAIAEAVDAATEIVRASGTVDRAVLLQAITLRLAALVVDPAELAVLKEQLERIMPKLVALVELLAELDDATKSDVHLVGRIVDAMADVVVAFDPAASGADIVDLMRAVAAFATGRFSVGVARLGAIDIDWLPGNAQKVVAALLEYGGLVAGLAEAETDEDAQKILEAAAAPLGSYRDFRRSGWAGYISGYAGIAPGRETGSDVKDDYTFAPVLPIGVEFGRPLVGSCSFNVLVSVLDVGAVAVTRLKESDVEGAAMTDSVRRSTEEDLAGVLAPGLFVSVGLGTSPFVAGIGAEYLPASRAVYECPDANPCETTRTVPVGRFMAFIAIDMPVFPLFR